MEWNGMEWNGMEWNGMEWNGMEWNGMEWNGMEWNGMEWNGMEWSGVEWNGMEWNGVEWNGMEWNGMEWNETHRAVAQCIVYVCRTGRGAVLWVKRFFCVLCVCLWMGRCGGPRGTVSGAVPPEAWPPSMLNIRSARPETG